jgi:hypothetical protein
LEARAYLVQALRAQDSCPLPILNGEKSATLISSASFVGAKINMSESRPPVWAGERGTGAEVADRKSLSVCCAQVQRSQPARFRAAAQRFLRTLPVSQSNDADGLFYLKRFRRSQLRARSHVKPHANHARRPFTLDGWLRLTVCFEVSIAGGVNVTLNKPEGFILVLG